MSAILPRLSSIFKSITGTLYATKRIFLSMIFATCSEVSSSKSMLKESLCFPPAFNPLISAQLFFSPVHDVPSSFAQKGMEIVFSSSRHAFTEIFISSSLSAFTTILPAVYAPKSTSSFSNTEIFSISDGMPEIIIPPLALSLLTVTSLSPATISSFPSL